MTYRIFAIDTETTGLDQAQVFQYAFIECNLNQDADADQDLLTIKNKITGFCKPNKDIEAGATEIHGYTNEQVQAMDVPNVADINLYELLELNKGDKIFFIGHNVQFDITAWKNSLSGEQNKEVLNKAIPVCTKNMAKNLEIEHTYETEGNRLVHLVTLLGYDDEYINNSAHDAYIDANWCIELINFFVKNDLPKETYPWQPKRTLWQTVVAYSRRLTPEQFDLLKHDQYELLDWDFVHDEYYVEHNGKKVSYEDLIKLSKNSASINDTYKFHYGEQYTALFDCTFDEGWDIEKLPAYTYEPFTVQEVMDNIEDFDLGSGRIFLMPTFDDDIYSYFEELADKSLDKANKNDLQKFVDKGLMKLADVLFIKFEEVGDNHRQEVQDDLCRTLKSLVHDYYKADSDSELEADDFAYYAL